MNHPCGWIPFEDRTAVMNANHERIVAGMAAFPANELYRGDDGRVCLWQAGVQLFGKFLKYNFQTTGSCVGAGGGNMAKNLMAVEIAIGNEPEEYKELWWPFTYGRSRFRSGMTSPGEGSLGSAYAEAAIKDGYLAVDEKDGLPAFSEEDGWLKLSKSVELSWSDGDARQSLDCMDVARKHLIGAAARLRNAQEWKAALQNGYPVTLASNFGTTGIRKRGNPAVNIGDWNASWAHQMSSSEAWDHPDLGLILLIQNNWGPEAHPAPTQGEPPGGFYILEKTADRICASGEVYAFSGFNGFVSRTIPWIF